MPDTPPVTLALEHMTGPSRGSISWLNAATLDITLDAGCFVHVSEARAGEPRSDLVARLHRVDGSYEIEAKDKVTVWVNGKRISASRLKHGDTIEFGETGPLCRARFFTDHSRVRNSVTDIISDIVAYLRVSRKPLGKRVFRACGALFGRLSHETTILFRITVIGAIIGLGFLVLQQSRLNTEQQESIDSAAVRLDGVATALVQTQNDALRPGDLTALREELGQRVTSNVTRLQDLELRATASGRVISKSIDSVAFLQGAFGFREVSGERMLRQVVSAAGIPLISPRGRPMLSLEGNGPVAELQFTGTGFVVGDEGLLITNRHVAVPWEQYAGSGTLAPEGVEPVMIKFLSYLPGNETAVPVELVLASESADLAVLRRVGVSAATTGLRLAQAQPASGDEVIVMGYPTGLRSMLAQSGAEFVEELQKTENIGFWSVAARLAEESYIAPLASRGIVGQVTASVIVYDAETTHGGSGGPVLDVNGDVVAVNTAILPEYGGSNLGVPVEKVRVLLEKAAGE